MTPKEILLINDILDSIGLESIKKPNLDERTNKAQS